jgi:hypothetical protein
MADEKAPQQVTNMVFPTNLDYGSLLLSTRDMTIQNQTDLLSFKNYHQQTQTQIFSMFNEVKADVTKTSETLGDRIDGLDKSLNKQTLILTAVIVGLMILSKTKFSEILSLIGG